MASVIDAVDGLPVCSTCGSRHIQTEKERSDG
jgi:hypothetical protein